MDSHQGSLETDAWTPMENWKVACKVLEARDTLYQITELFSSQGLFSSSYAQHSCIIFEFSTKRLAKPTRNNLYVSWYNTILYAVCYTRTGEETRACWFYYSISVN